MLEQGQPEPETVTQGDRKEIAELNGNGVENGLHDQNNCVTNLDTLSNQSSFNGTASENNVTRDVEKQSETTNGEDQSVVHSFFKKSTKRASSLTSSVKKIPLKKIMINVVHSPEMVGVGRGRTKSHYYRLRGRRKLSKALFFLMLALSTSGAVIFLFYFIYTFSPIN